MQHMEWDLKWKKIWLCHSITKWFECDCVIVSWYLEQRLSQALNLTRKENPVTESSSFCFKLNEKWICSHVISPLFKQIRLRATFSIRFRIKRTKYGAQMCHHIWLHKYFPYVAFIKKGLLVLRVNLTRRHHQSNHCFCVHHSPVSWRIFKSCDHWALWVFWGFIIRHHH